MLLRITTRPPTRCSHQACFNTSILSIYICHLQKGTQNSSKQQDQRALENGNSGKTGCTALYPPSQPVELEPQRHFICVPVPLVTPVRMAGAANTALGLAHDVSYSLYRVVKSTGKAAWIAGTSALILLIPLIIEMDREQQMTEFEAQQLGALTGQAQAAK